MMSVELLRDEYKTPLAVVRGVFLCEDVADTMVSARASIRQEDWDLSSDVTPIGASDWQGDIDLPY
jgi:hypothetical protein